MPATYHDGDRVALPVTFPDGTSAGHRRRVGSELRREIDGGVLQDRVRPPQLEGLLAEPLQLFALVCRQQVTPAAAVCLGLPDPEAKRLLVHAQVLGDVRDRTLRLDTSRTAR